MLELFKSISTFAFDVDGVLTDGSLFLPDDGQMVRRMNIKDGYALQLAIKKGYDVVVISGAHSEAVVQRLLYLGITNVFTKVNNKKEKIVSYIRSKKISRDEILFMGDDIPDYLAMQEVGLPVCPADAVPEIKQIAKYISGCNGGNGCVRDVIEKVLKLNGHWDIDENIAAK